MWQAKHPRLNHRRHDIPSTPIRSVPAVRGDRVYYVSVGCEVCNQTGYRGRTAIHELLDMSDSIRELIIDRKPGSEVRRVAIREGLGSLRESALRLVFEGDTTLHEINRVTFVEEVE